jgi:hypothetical protein
MASMRSSMDGVHVVVVDELADVVAEVEHVGDVGDPVSWWPSGAPRGGCLSC